MNLGTLTLEDYANIAQIVGGIGGVVIAAVSAAFAWFGYNWLKLSARVEARRRLSDALRQYNELVLQSPDFQKSEAAGHPWGPISEADVVRMYRHFLTLNLSVDLWEAMRRDAIEPHTYHSFIRHTANTTFSDREFIKKHVLPRGYPQLFRDELQSLWTRIDAEGLLKAA
jgi:hypothetical protein